MKELIQDNPTLASLSSILQPQQYKRIDYDYDLISGKVNEVTYQKDQPDQFIHKYEYDADNRITNVYTSENNVLWDRDAKYFYYAHGPLARTELGDDQVQGIDYAYTLQGWIKGVNSNLLVETNDMGRDGDTSLTGNANRYFARDGFGYTLNYFDGDYRPIDTTRWVNDTLRFEATTAGSDVMANTKDLFNGNIKMMATTIAPPLTTSNTMLAPVPQANAYGYDQLNRLVYSKSFDNIDAGTDSWQNGSTYINRYYNQFTYDANGNIETQDRYDDHGTMKDEFEYLYDSTQGCDPTWIKANNRLLAVKNYAPSSMEEMNFAYDAIGNLVKDDSAKIDTIYWTISGKIKQITRSGGTTLPNLIFDYDPSGNRIAKKLYDGTWQLINGTYYIRDAQGNILSTYEYNQPANTYTLKERDIYGSSRLGLNGDSLEMIGASALNTISVFNRSLGLKQYELTNHLGNVIATVSDKKLFYASSSTIDFYEPDLISAQDYYPFGMMMVDRNFTSDLYRYGFNGQEKVDEVNGESNHNTALFWEYDSRLGRRWNIDPKPKIGISDYSAFRGTPILFSDQLGDVVHVDGTKREQRQYTRMLNRTSGNKYGIDKSGDLFNKGGTVNNVTNNKVSGELSGLIESSIASTEVIDMNLTKNDDNVSFDRYKDAKVDLHDLKISPREFQAGQLAHIFSERLNWSGGFSNIANRTDANWNTAHNNFAIPAESRVITGMLGIPYAPRNIISASPTGQYQEPYTDQSGTYNITKFTTYTEVWQYNTMNYTMIMGIKNNITPAASSTSGIPHNTAVPQVGMIFKIIK